MIFMTRCKIKGGKIVKVVSIRPLSEIELNYILFDFIHFKESFCYEVEEKNKKYIIYV